MVKDEGKATVPAEPTGVRATEPVVVMGLGVRVIPPPAVSEVMPPPPPPPPVTVMTPLAPIEIPEVELMRAA